jgi:DNA-binding GntR family transcriptional regulator
MIRLGDHDCVTRGHDLPSEHAYRVIRDRITTGEYAPGQQLPTVGELARTLGVARATVVKALARLQADGYVVSRPRWASFVSDSPPSPDKS